MSVHIGHLRPVSPPHVAAAGAAAGQAHGSSIPAVGAGGGTVTADVIPASPPKDVSAQVAGALERAHELYARNRELHFTKDQESGRIVVEVRDLEGNVLR